MKLRINFFKFLSLFILSGCAYQVFTFDNKLSLFLDYDVSNKRGLYTLKVSDPYKNLSGVLTITPSLYAFYYCEFKNHEGFPIVSKEYFLPQKSSDGHTTVVYHFSCSAKERELKAHILKSIYHHCHESLKKHPDIKELCEHLNLRYPLYQ